MRRALTQSETRWTQAVESLRVGAQEAENRELHRDGRLGRVESDMAEWATTLRQGNPVPTQAGGEGALAGVTPEMVAEVCNPLLHGWWGALKQESQRLRGEFLSRFELEDWRGQVEERINFLMHQLEDPGEGHAGVGQAQGQRDDPP